MELFRNQYDYAPLRSNLEGYWDKSFEQLPDELIELVGPAFFPYLWDSIENRQSLAAQIDYQSDPNMERSLYFNLCCFQDDLKNWIEAARQGGKDAAVVALRDALDSVRNIVDTDRGRVGTEIQKLRAAASTLQTMQAEADALRARLAAVEGERDALLATVEKLRKTPGKRAEGTYQHIIGALLECINGALPGIDKHPSFANESALIAFIAERYEGFDGLSQSNLSRKFPEARQTLQAE